MVITGCNNRKSKKDSDQTSRDTAVQAGPATSAESNVLALTKGVMAALRDSNYKALAAFIHPSIGVRFTPYGYVDTVQDIVLKPGEILNELSGQPVTRTWGEFDGTGDPIKMTLKAYMNKFVYDVDFSTPEVININKIVSLGNAPDNIRAVYGDVQYTESHFSGFDKKYDGMDWRSLRLVFKNIEGKDWLVGIIHDQWTI